ncbi:type II secretion system F family protein [Enterobacter ludwigii]|uniref:type II secretion system F family protein n=1 Tax=Enterobacter ludwigii TaxID=299767 RepID=UPI003F70EF31
MSLSDLRQRLGAWRTRLPSTDGLNEHVGRWLAQKTFSTGDRMELYEDLAFQLDNNLKLDNAMNAIIGSYEGKKPKPPVVLCLEDALRALQEGKSLDAGLTEWIPRQESAILSAGVQDGRLAEALRRAMMVVEGQGKMKGTLLATLFNPLMQIITTIAMNYMVYSHFLPTLRMLAPPERWTGSVWWLAHISIVLVENAWLLGGLLTVAIAAILWSLPNLTGPVRRVLDRLPPWGIYRDINGVSFLLNFSALMRAQVKTEDALESLSLHATPWLYERLAATRRQVSAGHHLGLALRHAGYGFPSPQAINKLAMMTGNDNAEQIIENFAAVWLAKTVARIERLASRLSLAALLITGGYMALIIMATQSLNTLVGNH